MAETRFTKGNETRLILEFAMPVMAGSLLMQLYNYVDAVIVGNFINKEALAAVGASAPFIFTLVSLVIGISIGSSIMISQCYGRGDMAGIKRISDTLYIFLFFASLLLTLLGILFNRRILELIGLPEEVMPYAMEYLRIYLLGIVFLFIFNSLSSILRGVGDSKTPLLFLFVSSVLNILLDLLFVPVFSWGIAGAAWATVIAEFLAVVFAVGYTNRYTPVIKLNVRSMTFDFSVFRKSLKLGIPAGLQQLFVSLGMLAVWRIVNGFGTDATAAYSAANRIETFVAIVPMALSIAITNFTAQNMGTEAFGRVRNGIRAVMKMNLTSGLLILLLLSALGTPLMKMFTQDAQVIRIGVEYLMVLAFSYWIFGAMFCYMGAMRGLGNTLIPMLVSLISLWLIRVPVAAFLSSCLGELGIWLSAPAAWLLGLVAVYWVYRRKMKKEMSGS